MSVQWTIKRNDLQGSRWDIWQSLYQKSNLISWKTFKDSVLRFNPHINRSTGWCFIAGEEYLMPGDYKNMFSTAPMTIQTYTIRLGDTFSRIARKHSISVNDLKMLNPQIKDINVIHPGQIIYIPENTDIVIETSWNSDIPWFEIAEQEHALGVVEIPGPTDNPRIIEYHRCTTYDQDLISDEVPWCSSFVNWCMRESGYEGTKSALARSWLDWGKPLTTPQKGCIIITSRGKNIQQGHVGFYYSETSTHIRILGGNQSNQVKISNYPKTDKLGYRWPNQSQVV